MKFTVQERGVSYETTFEGMEVEVTVRKISTGETESVKYHLCHILLFSDMTKMIYKMSRK